jgi:adenylate cyclase
MRLSPLHPLCWIFSGGLAAYHVIAGRCEKAIEWTDRSLRELPRYESALRNRVAACAHLGGIGEARDGLERLLKLQPGLTIARYDALYGTVFSQQIHGVYTEGLRKAGLPEG